MNMKIPLLTDDSQCPIWLEVDGGGGWKFFPLPTFL